jgi:hypothetical protein
VCALQILAQKLTISISSRRRSAYAFEFLQKQHPLVTRSAFHIFDLGIHDHSSGALLLLAISAFVAALARGFSGFGSALIFVPLASTAIGPRAAAPLLLIIDGVAAARLIPGAWRLADKRDVGTMSVGALAPPRACRRAADRRLSITLSSRTRIEGGTSRSSAFAVQINHQRVLRWELDKEIADLVPRRCGPAMTTGVA